ncbi:MAG: hypothetical protein AABX31_02855 [Nanoarchaeota archaeon]
MNKQAYSLITFLAITSCHSPIYTIPPEDSSLYRQRQEPEYSLDDVLDEAQEDSKKAVTEELTKIKVKSYFDTLSPEYKALLDTISWAEYTLEPCLEGVSPHQVLVAGIVVEDKHHRYGGKFEECPGNHFVGFSDHPRIKVKWHNRARASTAAGKLQWMEQTYDGLRNLKECGPTKTENCGLFTDFTPDAQDEAGLYVVQKQNGVTPEMLEQAIQSGDFKAVWKKLARTWASLPYYNWKGRGVGYYRRQRNARSFESLKEKYMEKYELYRSRS